MPSGMIEISRWRIRMASGSVYITDPYVQPDEDQIGEEEAALAEFADPFFPDGFFIVNVYDSVGDRFAKTKTLINAIHIDSIGILSVQFWED
jgi:hypothetical protein